MATLALIRQHQHFLSTSKFSWNSGIYAHISLNHTRNSGRLYFTLCIPSQWNKDNSVVLNANRSFWPRDKNQLYPHIFIYLCYGDERVRLWAHTISSLKTRYCMFQSLPASLSLSSRLLGCYQRQMTNSPFISRISEVNCWIMAQPMMLYSYIFYLCTMHIRQMLSIGMRHLFGTCFNILKFSTWCYTPRIPYIYE